MIGEPLTALGLLAEMKAGIFTQGQGFVDQSTVLAFPLNEALRFAFRCRNSLKF